MWARSKYVDPSPSPQYIGQVQAIKRPHPLLPLSRGIQIYDLQTSWQTQKAPHTGHRQFYTPFMFGQMYVPVSMLTRIGNTLKDTNTHTDSNWPPNKSEQFYTPFMIGQIPWAANLLFLMTLTLMCDPRSENELFSLKLLKGLDLHISVDWWQHIHTQTKIHGILGLTYHIFISSSHSNMRIRVVKYKYTHFRTHIHQYTQICTLRHTTRHISRDSAKRVRPFGRSWILTELTDGRRKTLLPSS